MRRRDFITLLGGAAASWPLAAHAQQGEQMRRLGWLSGYPESDPLGQADIAELRQALQNLGWIEGRNLSIDARWGVNVDRTDPERIRRFAHEVVALAPDVIVTAGGGPVRELQRASSTVPIVFSGANDPVGAGLIESLSRPGTNATGLSMSESGQSAKLIELLKETAPGLRRAAVVRNPSGTGGPALFSVLQVAAGTLGMEVRPVDAADAGAIERGLAAVAREQNVGVVVPNGLQAQIHRELIVKLAAQHRLPAVYGGRLFAVAGGLLSYGYVQRELYVRVAGYVDRIFRGEKPADLPTQMPTRYETVLNMKAAKALGLNVPASILLRADEVIE
jgi:putative ABC transport system substrate-binding protein